MKKGNAIFIWTACLLMAAAGYAHGQKVASQALSPEGQKVVDYLLADWQERFRSTTIPHAMANLGMEASDDLRLEIIRHLRSNPGLARNLRFWGANNYLLTNKERRIAKYLLNTNRDENRLPDIRELSAAYGAGEVELRGRLAFMANAGLLATAGTEPLGYELAQDAEQWGGPLRHNFHTITIGDQPIFDVWWAVDFLLLVNSFASAGQTVKMDDSCAHCSDPIHVEISGGRITRSDPESVWVQQGGGWVVDNLFRSEEHLGAWLNQNPDYKNLNQLPLAEFLEQMED